MLGPFAALTSQLAHNPPAENIVRWAAPVPYFGRLEKARLATVGINPSNLEFLDFHGIPLRGSKRRLETLESLGIESWRHADGRTIRAIAKSCSRYFELNPYRRWFDVLERVLSATGHSYYRGDLAAHIDLVPYATVAKWGTLPRTSKRSLIAQGRHTLAEIIRGSEIQLLVLNGRSVVNAFAASSGVELTATELESLQLPRKNGNFIKGIRWDGYVNQVAGYDLGRTVRVIGFNHNLQSSYGVTTNVLNSVGEEVGLAVA